MPRKQKHIVALNTICPEGDVYIGSVLVEVEEDATEYLAQLWEVWLDEVKEKRPADSVFIDWLIENKWAKPSPVKLTIVSVYV